jgi:uncharacterized protein
MAVLSGKKVSPVTIAPPILPQVVPSSACFRCDTCCRFPDADSPLRPFFTGKEIARAVEHGVEARAFTDLHGCQIGLLPDPQGEGFLCPVFDRQSGACRIYEQRPLDCQLYPLVLMWSATQDQVVLGWDVTCPFMRDEVPESIRSHADHVLSILAERDTVHRIAEHPRLIGRFQEGVVILAPLRDITQAVFSRWGPQPVRRLVAEDIPYLRAAVDRSGLSGSVAAYSVPYHYMWNALLPYWWIDLHGAVCLFVQSPDGWFMPVPPLTDGCLERPLREAFQLMRRWNRGTAVSRVENVPAQLVSALTVMGYRIAPKSPEYLYRADALARLAGDRYKSQRALCNRIERDGGVVIEPYCARDRAACRTLWEQWRGQKRAPASEPLAEWLLEDSQSAHEIALSHASALQLAGSVIRKNGKVCGYTFGYWLDQRTWCVLLEVADRTIPGLAQYLFRETCRKARTEGAEFINTMDDSGLSGLRCSKEAYHPVARIESFICSESPEQ